MTAPRATTIPACLNLRDDIGSIPADQENLCLLLGDSCQYGYGLDSGQTVASLLEQFLANGKRKTFARCVNAGVPNFSAMDAALYARLFLRHLAPSLIVWTFCSNDAEMLPATQGMTHQEHIDATWEEGSPCLPYLERAFSLVAEFGCPVITLYVNDAEHPLHTRAQGVFRDLSERFGFRHIDGYEIISRVPPRERGVGPEDAHPSEQVNMLLAKRISNIVKKEALLPAARDGEDRPDPAGPEITSPALAPWLCRMKREGRQLSLDLDLLLLRKGCEVMEDDRLRPLFMDALRAKLPAGIAVADPVGHIRDRLAALHRTIAVETPPADIACALRPLTDAMDGLKDCIARIDRCAEPDYRAALADKALAVCCTLTLLNHFHGYDVLCASHRVMDGHGVLSLGIEADSPGDRVMVRIKTREPEVGFHTMQFYCKLDGSAVIRRLPPFDLADVAISVTDDRIDRIKAVRLHLDGRMIKDFDLAAHTQAGRILLPDLGPLLDRNRPLAGLEAVRGKSVAICPGGPTTELLLREYDLSACRMMAVMDRTLRGSLCGLPMEPMADVLQRKPDHILVNSLSSYAVIRRDLEAAGLVEHQDFSAILI